MQIQIIAVGRIRQHYLTPGIKEYKKRLQKYGSLRICEIKEETYSEPLSPLERERILRREGERIIAQIPTRAYVFALDRRGQKLTSKELAKQFQTLAVGGTSQLSFIIGGSLGLHSSVTDRVQFSLSFSRFTFPHQLMRLILVEQIYRAFTIINGERYHK